MITKNFNVGDVVEYKLIGDDSKRLVIVTEKHADVKHGRPGFSGYIPSEHGDAPESCSYWGYSEDITRVWRKVS